MSDAVAITERLFIGPPEAAYGFADMLPVEDASDAMTAIRSGHSALLPPGRWDLAAAVLKGFGADDEHVAWLFQVAGKS